MSDGWENWPGNMCKHRLRDGELRLDGEVDLSNKESFAAVLNDALKENPALIINALDLSYSDSEGLGVILTAIRRAGGEANFSIVCPEDGIVRQVLRFTRVDDLIHIHSSLSNARKALAA